MVHTRDDARLAAVADDLRLGHLTQEWLATSAEPEARTSGGYWHHQRRAEPHPASLDPAFQDELLDVLARRTGTELVRSPGRCASGGARP